MDSKLVSDILLRRGVVFGAFKEQKVNGESNCELIVYSPMDIFTLVMEWSGKKYTFDAYPFGVVLKDPYQNNRQQSMYDDNFKQNDENLCKNRRYKINTF